VDRTVLRRELTAEDPAIYAVLPLIAYIWACLARVFLSDFVTRGARKLVLGQIVLMRKKACARFDEETKIHRNEMGVANNVLHASLETWLRTKGLGPGSNC